MFLKSFREARKGTSAANQFNILHQMGPLITNYRLYDALISGHGVPVPPTARLPSNHITKIHSISSEERTRSTRNKQSNAPVFKPEKRLLLGDARIVVVAAWVSSEKREKLQDSCFQPFFLSVSTSRSAQLYSGYLLTYLLLFGACFTCARPRQATRRSESLAPPQDVTKHSPRWELFHSFLHTVLWLVDIGGWKKKLMKLRWINVTLGFLLSCVGLMSASGWLVLLDVIINSFNDFVEVEVSTSAGQKV